MSARGPHLSSSPLSLHLSSPASIPAAPPHFSPACSPSRWTAGAARHAGGRWPGQRGCGLPGRRARPPFIPISSILAAAGRRRFILSGEPLADSSRGELLLPLPYRFLRSIAAFPSCRTLPGGARHPPLRLLIAPPLHHRSSPSSAGVSLVTPWTTPCASSPSPARSAPPVRGGAAQRGMAGRSRAGRGARQQRSTAAGWRRRRRKGGGAAGSEAGEERWRERGEDDRWGP